MSAKTATLFLHVVWCEAKYIRKTGKFLIKVYYVLYTIVHVYYVYYCMYYILLKDPH